MSRSTLRKAAKVNPDAIRRLARYLGIRCADRAHIQWVAHMCYKFHRYPHGDWRY